MLDMKGSAQKLRFDLTDHIAWGATHKRRSCTSWPCIRQKTGRRNRKDDSNSAGVSESKTTCLDPPRSLTMKFCGRLDWITIGPYIWLGSVLALVVFCLARAYL